MSSQPKEENYYNKKEVSEDKKVDLTVLVNRMNSEKKKETKNNIILSAAAISAVTVFGIILTL